MAWVRTDDNAPNHPKFFRAGVAAFGFDFAGICYCNRNLTDGFIPASDLPLVFPGVTMRAALGLATKLVEVGRWQKDDEREGYQIHDYLHYQPCRERVIADRAIAKAGRIAGGLARAKFAERDGGRFTSSAPAADQQRTSSPAGSRHQDLTSPTPTPKPKEEEATTLSGSRPTAHAGNGYRQEARAILEWLNLKAGKNFEFIDTNLKPIEARLREGREAWQLRKIVAVKARKWAADETMREYLRPATLFNKTKCAQYIGELPKADEVEHGLP
jgi:uncharacterized phage protein (TIGR02220 family)